MFVGIYEPDDTEDLTNSSQHCVKIIGWGKDNGRSFWQVANSWGQTWGEQGYFKFPQNDTHLGFGTLAIAPVPESILVGTFLLSASAGTITTLLSAKFQCTQFSHFFWCVVYFKFMFRPVQINADVVKMF